MNSAFEILQVIASVITILTAVIATVRFFINRKDRH